MKITVRRFEYADKYTISKLYINDSTEFECYVLEDVVRAPGVKVFGETAIPAGEYNVIVDYSEHFKTQLPHIMKVPGFEGVRIHPGNTDKDTEGCLLVGKDWNGGDGIFRSREAFGSLFAKISSSYNKKETITLKIIDTK